MITLSQVNIFMSYILPVLIVLGVAVVFAVLLGFLGTKLSVKKDLRVDEVRERLAGANCGGCGYPGCDAFAEALVRGEAKLSDCNPTAKDRKSEIAKILGTADAVGEETVAVVHCAGGNRCRQKYDYNGYGDCESCHMLSGGSKQCSVGCMGLGSCVESCEYDAIHVDTDTGYARVDVEKCTSCGKCISTCPVSLITRIQTGAEYYCACSNTQPAKAVMAVCEVGCIGCGKCARVCPEGAITMKDNLPVFDYTKCVNCGKCFEACPRHIIFRHE